MGLSKNVHSEASQNFWKSWTKVEDLYKLSKSVHRKFLEKLGKSGRFIWIVQGCPEKIFQKFGQKWRFIQECPRWAHMETLENFAYEGLYRPDSTEMAPYGAAGKIWFREMGNGGRTGKIWEEILVELVKSGNRPLAAGQNLPILVAGGLSKF